MQVLLVDDSPVMRRYVGRALKMTGMNVEIHEAADGVEAIRIANRVKPDLIITDLNMPSMNGLELVERLHQTKELKTTPVLVLTADHSPGRPEQLRHAGALSYLTKPVTPEVLKIRVSEMLELPL